VRGAGHVVREETDGVFDGGLRVIFVSLEFGTLRLSGGGFVSADGHHAEVVVLRLDRLGTDEEAAGVDVERIREDMLREDPDGSDEGVIGAIACAELVDVVINLHDEEHPEGIELAPGVAGCVGITGQFDGEPCSAVVQEDTLEHSEVTWGDVLVQRECSVDQEVEEDVLRCRLVGVYVLNERGAEGAVVSGIILIVGCVRRSGHGEEELTSNLVDEVHVPGVPIANVRSAGAEGRGGYPSKDSEVVQRWRSDALNSRTMNRDDEVIG
jgi:hypothetical protein